MSRIKRKFEAQVEGVFLALVGAFVLIACADRPEPHAVSMVEGKRFAPAAITVPVGATVVWHNRSPDRHTLVADPADARAGRGVRLPAGAPAWGSGELFHDERWAHTFTAPGVYLYVCGVHAGEEMIATVVVEE